MLISFSGSNSTGKSTLLHECKQNNAQFKKQFNFVEEVTRKIARQGIPINTEGNNLTQLLIVGEHIQNSLLENTILDRCILDGLVYTEYLFKHNKVESWVYYYARRVYDMLLPKYNVIFYTSPKGILLEDDGTREIGIKGEEFRNGVIERFNYHIATDEILKSKIVILEGSVEERLNIVIKTINNL